MDYLSGPHPPLDSNLDIPIPSPSSRGEPELSSLHTRLGSSEAGGKQLKSTLASAPRPSFESLSPFPSITPLSVDSDTFDVVRRRPSAGDAMAASRGIPANLALALDESRADYSGMRRHEEVIYNYDITLHADPVVVRDSIMGPW